ncbi:MAG: ABC transporter substrate-binding protein [Alphaproteobacteria bacterium]|nr:ABC transporter substrate-binding protein [Alphaproteobacteria bacterium]
MADSYLHRSADGAAVSRRTAIKLGTSAAAIALAAPAVIIPGRARAADKLALISWGGGYRKAWEEAFVNPFVKETGIEVVIADTPDLAKVKAQVTSKNVEWDVFDCPGSMALAGAAEGFWEPLDKKIIDTSDVYTAFGADYLPYYMFAGGVGWDPKRHAPGKAPADFVQLFDAAKFPGRRGLRTRISETLDIALLGDGVAPDKLYPLDVERGFKALDKIKPHVKKWIAETPQTISLVQNNEIDFSYTYSGRVKAAQKDGVSIEFSWAQTINALNYLTVLKGSKRKDAAMRLIAFTLRPDRAAAFAELLGYTPTVNKALPLITPETRRWMPDMKNPKNVVMDDLWWQKNYTALQKRYSEWQLT